MRLGCLWLSLHAQPLIMKFLESIKYFCFVSHVMSAQRQIDQLPLIVPLCHDGVYIVFGLLLTSHRTYTYITSQTHTASTAAQLQSCDYIGTQALTEYWAGQHHVFICVVSQFHSWCDGCKKFVQKEGASSRPSIALKFTHGTNSFSM